MNQSATCTNSPTNGVSSRMTVHADAKAPSLARMAPSPRPGASKGERPHRPLNPLARLIRRRKEDLELTWPELAKRGGFNSHTIIYTLATKQEHKTVPRAETLQKLAVAIDVPLDMVRAAAAEAAGFTVQDIPTSLGAATDVRIVAAVMGDLDEGDRKTLVALAESFHTQVQRRRRESQG